MDRDMLNELRDKIQCPAAYKFLIGAWAKFVRKGDKSFITAVADLSEIYPKLSMDVISRHLAAEMALQE